MTNFEAIITNNPQFVKEVLSHHVFDSDLKHAIDDNRKRYAWYNEKHTADKEGIKFLQAEYTPQVLDAVEREYLSDVIRPFKNKIKSIRKAKCDGKYFIEINMKQNYDNACLPFFSTKSGMYKGMELSKRYTLNELGL